MTDGPSPYAPGIIAEEQAAARAPGRAIVFLVAAFAISLAFYESLWHSWLGRAVDESEALPAVYNRVLLVWKAVAMPTLLWAYLTDVVPLFGSRREGYLLIGGMLATITWAVLAFAGDHLFIWYGAAAVFGLVTAVVRVALVGAFTQIGHRRQTTGPLVATYFGVTNLGLLAGWGLLSPIELLPLAWSAGLGMALGLSIVLVVVTLADNRDPTSSADAPAVRVTIPRFLRSRVFWTSLAVMLCAALANVPREMVALAQAHLSHTPYQRPEPQWTTPALLLAGNAVYLIACRYLRFRALLRFGLLAKAVALVLIARSALAMTAETEETVEMLRSAGEGVAGVAFLHLAMRVAPPGREAFGVSLLVALPTVVAGTMNWLVISLIPSVSHVALIASGLAILAALLVSLLPRDVH